MRTERALDDPVREMEGMLVDEYGRFEFVHTECLTYLFAHFWSVFTYCLFDFVATQLFSCLDSACPKCLKMKMIQNRNLRKEHLV